MPTKAGRGTADQAAAGVTRQQGMGPIQVVPTGLMGLLQLKQTGKLPGTLSETVVGVIELRDWYLTSRRLDNIALGLTLGPNTLTTGQEGNRQLPTGGVPSAVPQNQLWYVEQFDVTCDNAGAMVATDLVRFAPGILSPNGTQHLTGPDVSDYTLVARTRTIRARSDRGFWAFPGDQFIVQVFDLVTTNGYTFNGTFRATPCPI